MGRIFDTPQFWDGSETRPTHERKHELMADDQQPPKDERAGKESFVVTLARYSQLAFTLPAATVVGWLIGYGLDRWLHTSFLYLVGLLLGIVAGFVELIKTVSKES